MDAQTLGKKLAGEQAASLVKDGSVVGLGTGSTAAFATKAIARRMQEERLRVRGVCTSTATEKLARDLSIPLLDFATAPSPDIYIDGADEIDDSLTMIKGGGGALLREKLIAWNSQKRVIIVDESKRVKRLGAAFPLPVEVVRFGAEKSLAALADLFGSGNVSFRGGAENLFITDEGHVIVDCKIGGYRAPATEIESALRALPGVVTTGFFFGLCDVLIVGRRDGVETITQPKQGA